jgi:hypothetical protein
VKIKLSGDRTTILSRWPEHKEESYEFMCERQTFLNTSEEVDVVSHSRNFNCRLHLAPLLEPK